MDDRELLELQADTLFGHDAAGRIVFEDEPGHRPAPRLYLARGIGGAVLRLRHDVSDETARELRQFAAGEPPLTDASGDPIYLADYRRLLSREAPISQDEPGLVWELRAAAGPPPPTCVPSDSPEGDALIARLHAEGMPPAMIALGFVDTGEFWSPWCVALQSDEIVSIAFASRIGLRAAEVGVATVPEFRGHGFAAAATSAWAGHPQLRGRPLFYSTSRTNRSSQRVVQRLALRFIGTSLRIT